MPLYVAQTVWFVKYPVKLVDTLNFASVVWCESSGRGRNKIVNVTRSHYSIRIFLICHVIVYRHYVTQTPAHIPI